MLKNKLKIFILCLFCFANQAISGEIVGGGIIHFRGEIIQSPKPAQEINYSLAKGEKPQFFSNENATITIKTLPGNGNLKLMTVTYD